MNMLWALFSNFGGYIAAGVGAVVLLFSVKGAGRAQAELKQAKADADAADKAAAVRRDVAGADDASVRDQLRKRPWRK
jgi:hypothetical protein